MFRKEYCVHISSKMFSSDGVTSLGLINLKESADFLPENCKKERFITTESFL